MEKKNNNKLLIVLLIIMLLTIGGLVTYILFNNKACNESEETPVETGEKENETTTENDIENKDEIIKIFKNYYDNLIKKDLEYHDPKSYKYYNTEKYDVTDIKYIYSGNRYQVSYIYVCKDGNADCLAVEQTTSDKSPANANLCFSIVDGELVSPGSCVTTGPAMLTMEEYNEYYN